MKRRPWSIEEKIHIVCETTLSGESIKSVASRHHVHPTLLATWRRKLIDRFDNLLSVAHTFSELQKSDLRLIDSEIAIDKRRKWSVQDKLRIVIESYDGSVAASEVARKHDITPNQLFEWRRWAKQDHEASTILKATLGKQLKSGAKRDANHTTTRRKWTLDDKLRILEEAKDKKSSMSKVAKKYGLTPSQISHWRRDQRNTY
jgi:transposase-like protein